MTQKIYDLAVKVGEYTNSKNETKARYENIGSVMQKDDGGKFLLLKRCFNPAGVPFREGSESIIVSMFEPQEREQQQPQQQSRQQSGNGQQRQQQRAPQFNSDDDDIPF